MGFLSVKPGLKGPEVRTPTPPTAPLAGLPQQAHFLTPLIIDYPRHIYLLGCHSVLYLLCVAKDHTASIFD